MFKFKVGDRVRGVQQDHLPPGTVMEVSLPGPEYRVRWDKGTETHAVKEDWLVLGGGPAPHTSELSGTHRLVVIIAGLLSFMCLFTGVVATAAMDPIPEHAWVVLTVLVISTTVSPAALIGLLRNPVSTSLK